MADFSVSINRRDGSVEISGDDKAWVDAKLAQFEYVYKDVPGTKATALPVSHATSGAAKVASSATKTAKPRAASKASSKR